MRFLMMVICYLIAAPLLAAPLTSIEQQIIATIAANKNQQIQELEKLVNINSGTTNPEGVIKVGELLKPEFEKLGFTVTWVDEPKEMQRAPTFIAERKGTQGKKILLIGHLDTVFPRDSQFQQYIAHQHTAKGPGVIDDKGGILVILYALQALNEAHALDNTSITVVLTGDEEDSGKPTSISRKPLFAAAASADVALDYEPSVSLNTGTIARRGISSWTITTHGHTSHSAVIFHPHVGNGAIFELSRILNDMRAKLAKEKYLSFNPGIILGGTDVQYDEKASQGSAFGKDNVIAKTAIVRGDLRFVTDKQRKSAETRITAIVKKHLTGTTATVTYQDGIPAMQPTKQNIKLLEQYSKVSEDLKMGKVKALPYGLRGAGDISHIAAIVPANLAGLGPVGDAIHSNAESIELDTLSIQTKRTALLVYRLTR